MKKFISKHMQTITLALLMLTSAVSCRRGSTTHISTSDGRNSQTIEYSGKIVFTADQTGIEHITKGGYLKFERDDRELEVEPGKGGKLEYEFDGDDKINVLSDDQKRFVAEAVKTIIKERARLQARNKR